METNLNTNPTTRPENRKDAIAGGLILILAGTALLVIRSLDVGQYFLLALSAAFLFVGLYTRGSGWFIPAGVVGGIGAAAIVLDGPMADSLSEPASSGVFLLLFAAGWVSIAVLSRLFTRNPQDWALIPGGIMAAIGGLVMSGTTGVAILKFLGDYWPVAPILIGLAILVKALRNS